MGGRLLSVGAGRKDNRRLEARSDVITFTSGVLARDLDVIGEVRAESELGRPRRGVVTVAPTAQRFLRGHRIRVQVSGGSHPMFARNSGTDENVGTAARFVAADRRISHDPDHPSAILLPVASRGPREARGRS